MSDQNSTTNSVTEIDSEDMKEDATVKLQARIEELRRRFDARLRPEGVYLTDSHHRVIDEAFSALGNCSMITLTSENFAMAQYYKELCVTRLRADPSVRLLCFDPLSGSDLLSLLNEQLLDLPLDEIAARPLNSRRAKPAVLIIDNEELVSEQDWTLATSLATQLRGANIGVLCLQPRNTRSSLADTKSALIQVVELSLPSERELHNLLVFAQQDIGGNALSRILDSLELPTGQTLDESASSSQPLPESSDQESLGEAGRGGAKGEAVKAVLGEPLSRTNEVSHLSFRLFVALAIVELLAFCAYRLL